MSAAKHTPGPWVVEGGQQAWSAAKGSIETVLGGADGETVVASLCTGGGRFSDNAAALAQTKADARLIAAAPDLLEACETLLVEGLGVPLNSRTPLFDDVVRNARAAIAKARGGK